MPTTPTPEDQLAAEQEWPVPDPPEADPDAEHAPGWLTEPCPPPGDADEANRMMRTVVRLRGDKAYHEAVAEAEIGRTKRWLSTVIGPIDRKIAWLDRAISAWGRAVNEADDRKKTLKLPWGEVWARPRQAKVIVTTDPEDLALMRKKRPGWVREKLEAKLDPIKAAVVAGDPLDPQPEGIEDGYEACAAVLPGDHEAGVADEVVAGVTYLRPVGKKITVRPDGSK